MRCRPLSFFFRDGHMSAGRVIYKEISSSRRFNRLWKHGEIGQLAQLIYLITYSHSDNWGHLPFNEETIVLQAIPGYSDELENVLYGMCLLVYVKLWGAPYCVNDNLYIHIFNFEEKSKEGIRKRIRGTWPDESGVIPERERKNDNKLVSIDDCFANAAKIRSESTLYIDPITHPSFSGIFRKIQEYSDSYHHDLTLRPEKFGTTRDKLSIVFNDVAIGGRYIRPSFLIKVYKFLGSDLEQLGRVLFRARNARDIYSYVTDGLNNGWLKIPTSEEDVDPKYVREWVDSLFGIAIPQSQRKHGEITQIDAIIGDMLNVE